MAKTAPSWGEVFRAPPGITAEDVARMPDDGYRYELFEGELVREMTSPGHADICQRLGVELGIYARAAKFPHRILQNALFELSVPTAKSRTVLAPDVSIMRSASQPTWGVPQESPLLAIEVVSDSQTLAETAIKAQAYLSAGTEEVWVVDHKTRSIEVWNSGGMTTLTAEQTLTSPLLPGFELSVGALFEV